MREPRATLVAEDLVSEAARASGEDAPEEPPLPRAPECPSPDDAGVFDPDPWEPPPDGPDGFEEPDDPPPPLPLPLPFPLPVSVGALPVVVVGVLTVGLETVAPPPVTVAPEPETPTLGVVTPTLGVVTPTPPADTPTLGTVTVTLGTVTSTFGEPEPRLGRGTLIVGSGRLRAGAGFAGLAGAGLSSPPSSEPNGPAG